MSKNLSRHPLSIALFPASLLAIASVPAFAQDMNDSPDLLPGLQVTADWLGPPTEESENTYTGARTVVEEDDLQNRGALNLEDALRPVPGLHRCWMKLARASRGLNSLHSERLQMLVDGYPIAIGLQQRWRFLVSGHVVQPGGRGYGPWRCGGSLWSEQRRRYR